MEVTDSLVASNCYSALLARDINAVGRPLVGDGRGRLGHNFGRCLFLDMRLDGIFRLVGDAAHQRLGALWMVGLDVCSLGVRVVWCVVLGWLCLSRLRNFCLDGLGFWCHRFGTSRGMRRPHKAVYHLATSKMMPNMLRHNMAFAQIGAGNGVVALAVQLNDVLAHRFLVPSSVTSLSVSYIHLNARRVLHQDGPNIKNFYTHI